MRTVARDKLLQHYEVIDGAAIGPDRAVMCALFLPAMEAGEAVSQVFWYQSGEWHVGPMIGIECASLAWDETTQSALVLGRGVALAVAGIAVGLAGAAAMTRYLQSMLYGVTPLDRGTFLAVALAFAAVAAVASYFPARRATLVDPMVTLGTE